MEGLRLRVAFLSFYHRGQVVEARGYAGMLLAQELALHGKGFPLKLFGLFIFALPQQHHGKAREARGDLWVLVAEELAAYR